MIHMKEDDTEIDLLINKCLSGSASLQEREELRKEIAASKENRARFHELRNIWLTASPPFDPASISVDKAFRKTEKRQKGKQKKQWFLLRAKQLAAVLLLPALILNVYFYVKLNHSDSVGYQEVYTPTRTCSQIVLPDSSRVFLNSGSRLRYPLKFASASRDVELVGEGYFEVKANRSYPFIVHTKHAAVKAIGTAFNVEAYENDTLVSVTMEKGIVQMMPEGTSAFETLNIEPGIRVLYNLKTNTITGTHTDTYKYCSWKDGKLIFRNDPLSYVLKEISLMYNVDIELRDPEVAATPFRATFVDESLHDILHLITLSIPIEITEVERQMLVDGSFTKTRYVITKKRQ